MDARKITKVLLVLNVLFSACAGFPGAQPSSARGASYEHPQFNTNSNISQYYGNNAIVNRSDINKDIQIDNKDVQHASASNKVGEYGGYDQRLLSLMRAMPEAEVTPSKLAGELRAAYAPRGGSEHAVEQTEQLLSSNSNSRRKREGDYSQKNTESNITNYYEGDLRNTDSEKFSQTNIRSNITNHYEKTSSAPRTTTARDEEWIPTTPEKALALTDCSVVGGHTDNLGSLWVIRAMYKNDLIPGKLDVNDRKAYVPWNVGEHTVEQIEVFCAPPSSVDWVKSSNGHVPPNAILGGHTSSGDPLYIARATKQGSLIPGKLHPAHKCLYISYNGLEIHKEDYEVLCNV